MHVLYCSDARSYAGAERVLEVLIAHLPLNVHVSVFGIDEEVCDRLAAAAGERLRAVQVFPAPRFHGDPALVRRLGLAIRRLRPDVVHVNLTWPFSSIEVLLALMASPRTPVVAHEHMPLRMKTCVHAFVKRMLSRRIDEHVVVEENIGARLAAETGIRPKALRTIRNGVVMPADDVVAHERVDPRPTVLGLGRFTAQKGFDLLIDAVSGLPDTVLLLVGARSEAEVLEFENRAAAAGMADRLHIRPWTTDARRWMGAAELLAVSSRFEAGQLTLLEALTMRLPVVSTQVAYAPEVLGRLDPALLAPVDDVAGLRAAIRYALEDPDRARRLAATGRAIVESEFSAAAMTQTFVDLYASMSGSRPSVRTAGGT